MNVPSNSTAGPVVVRAGIVGTAVFLAAAVAALADSSLELGTVIVDLLLFAGGVIAFLWAYAVAIRRSREVLIGIGGLYFLQSSAPRSIQFRLLGALAIQVAGAFATAGVRPFSGLAFGVLVPVWGLGLCGLWAARYGTFPPRADSEIKPAG
jgi:hypothetical protein